MLLFLSPDFHGSGGGDFLLAVLKAFFSPLNGETGDSALPSLADFGVSCEGGFVEAIVGGDSGREVFWCGSVFGGGCFVGIFLLSLKKEMGESAWPQAAAAVPSGFTLCFFVLAVF